jgi:hypothetical protein
MKQVDARRLVVVDECGSNIALTPLSGWARHPGNASMAACHESRREKYDAPGFVVTLWHRRLYDAGRIRQYTGL